MDIQKHYHDKNRYVPSSHIEREKNQFYQALMNAPVVISVFRGPNLIIEFVNKIVHEIVGHDRILEGKALVEAYPDLDPNTVKTIKWVYRTGQTYTSKQQSVRLDYEHKGIPYERIWNLIHQPLFDDENKVTGVLTCAYEVTDHIKAINEVEMSREKLRLIADSIPIHLLILDQEERFLFVNQAASQMWNLSPEQFIGKTIGEVSSPETQQKLHPYTEKVLKGEQVYYESPFRLPNGEVRHFFNTYTPIYDFDKVIRGFIATGVDITERKNLESKIAQEQFKFETIFKNSPAAMALWKGPEMIFEIVNPGYQEIFPDRQLVGKTFLEAIPELKDQPFMSWLNKVFETGEPFNGKEFPARHINRISGEIQDHYYDFTYLRIDSEKGEPYGVYCHAIDVTERVLAKHATEKALNDLREERLAREQFVAALSHDLRTPLTASKVSAQLLVRKFGDNLEIKKLADRIASHIERSDGMIRDLLDVMRIKAGESLPLVMSECDLNKVISEVIEDLSAMYGDRLRVTTTSDIHGHWSCHGIRRILENLCNNAIKYGDPHEVVLISTIKHKDQVEIRVHNKGNPIAAEDMNKMFQPYHRTKSAVGGGKKGWGLGLTLVKGIIDAHKGKIAVESSKKKGTSFIVFLPI